MRVLYVINGFDPGGAEHGLLTLVENGAFDGHELRVLALCRGRGDLADRVVDRLGDRVQFVSGAQGLTLRACAAGFFCILRTARSFRPQKMVLSLKQVNVVGRLAALLMPRLTCVAFEHIAEYRARRLQGVYGPLLRLLSARVDEIWADCAETLEESQRYFRPRPRATHVVPLFVADDQAPFKTDYAVGSHLRLAAAGRLVPRKNLPLLIEVVRALRAEGIDAKLDVYGDGPQTQTLRALIAEHRLEGDVTLHGYCADWPGRAATADVFVNASDTEGFCIVVAEAMLAGIPVVAVERGGIRTYGRHDENMLKLATPDLEGVRAAIHRLAEDAALRERLGRRARADVLREYDAAACREHVAKALSSPRKDAALSVK